MSIVWVPDGKLHSPEAHMGSLRMIVVGGSCTNWGIRDVVVQSKTDIFYSENTSYMRIRVIK